LVNGNGVSIHHVTISARFRRTGFIFGEWRAAWLIVGIRRLVERDDFSSNRHPSLFFVGA
jgi:hypothetical protein